MPDYTNFYEARSIITGILHDDLVGPVSPEEVISELPTQYYIMGKLYPQCASGRLLILSETHFLKMQLRLISTMQMDEMEAEKVTLVVPKIYISTYPKDRQYRIWSLHKFVDYVKGLQNG